MKIDSFLDKLHIKPSVLFWSVLFLFILPISLIKIYDIDIWWHLQLGRSILENFEYPDFSEFYFTPVKQNTSNFRITWLGDILLYGIHFFSGDIGLQALRLAAVLILCFLLLRGAGDKKYKSWQLTLLMLLVVGTYQKQLIRNSLFALIFTPLIFWLWWKVRYEGKEKFIWIFPALLGLWSCIHGSYLLGFGLLLLILLGDLIDNLRGISDNKKGTYTKYFIVALLSFVAIALWNPQATSYFSLKKINKIIFMNYKSPKTGVESFNTANGSNNSSLDQVNGLTSEKLSQKHFLEVLKEYLNNTLLKRSNSIVNSADFVSPFEELDKIYVCVCLLVGAMSLLAILFVFHPIRISNLFPLLAILFFGTGYLRLTGYIPIFSIAVLFSAYANDNTRLNINQIIKDRVSIVFGCVSLIFLVAIYANFTVGYPIKIGTRLHSVGFGRIPIFSEKCTLRVLQEYPDNNVFNTIFNGGYLLYKWMPDKRVFVDGFFAPHRKEVFQDLKLLRKKAISPDVMLKKYGTDVALVDQASGSVIMAFMRSENWFPRYIDDGQIVFVHHAEHGSMIPIPEILFDKFEYQKTTGFFRERLATYSHVILNALIKKGRLGDAKLYETKNRSLLSLTKTNVHSEFIAETERLNELFVSVYGTVNSESARQEWIYMDAISNQQLDKAVDAGLKLLLEHPNRFPVLFNLASIFAGNGKLSKSGEFLDRIWTAQKVSPEYWQEKKSKIARLYHTLFQLERKRDGDALTAYQYAKKSYLCDDTFLSSERLYQAGITMSLELTKSKKPDISYDLLKSMEKDFIDSGRMMNEIAWHILSHRKYFFDSVENAKKYALKAVSIMETKKDPWLDLAYDTLAEACYQLKEYSKMRKYENLTIQAAPIERKKNYKPRTVENLS